VLILLCAQTLSLPRPALMPALGGHAKTRVEKSLDRQAKVPAPRGQ
jgi:hypothetical protein